MSSYQCALGHRSRYHSRESHVSLASSPAADDLYWRVATKPTGRGRASARERIHYSIALVIGIAALFVVLFAGSVGALGQERQGAQDGQEAKTRKPANVTPEMETAAMSFVQRNHPELSTLLRNLKDNRPREYQRAVRELYRASERLTRIQDRDETRFGLELASWKSRSRVRLLSAKLKMNDTPALRRQLRAALERQADDRVALLKHDQTKLTERLNRIQSQIDRLTESRDQVVQNQMKTLTGPQRKPRSKPVDPERTVPTDTPQTDTPQTADDSVN